jgi:hypothetical protein
MLFALDTKPPWWGRAGLWAGAGVLLGLLGILPWALTLSTMRPVSYPFSYALQNDGTWKFGAQGPGACMMFMTDGTYAAIPGASRCDVWLGVGVKNGLPFPPAGLTVDDVKAMRRSGSQQILDDLAADGAPEEQQRIAKAVLGMIIRGQKQESAGPLMALRPFLVGLGVMLLIPGAIVGNLRRQLLRGYEQRLASGAKGICPRCEYPMRGLSEPVCPECGLDVPRDMRESREEVAGPRRL